jgi:lipopolysaccharide/colanic/teichoic acid biosynthesis glycosyltransferase
MYQNFVKPVIDFTISLTGIVAFSPLLLLLALILSFLNKGKPFFFQERPGKDGKIFKIIKFKTMTDTRNSEGKLLPDAERLTTFGRYLRRMSIDELPQLINVLKGEMSLIGPRPLLPEYLPLYNEYQARRHEVRPGIIGWAQINGRNSLSWDERFKMDVWYVDNISLKLDLQIFAYAVMKVLKQEGINSPDCDTMERFLGNVIKDQMLDVS